MLYVNGAWRRHAKDPVKPFRFPFMFSESLLKDHWAVLKYVVEQLLNRRGVSLSNKAYTLKSYRLRPEGYLAKITVKTHYTDAEIERAADRGVCLKRGLRVGSFEILVYPRTS